MARHLRFAVERSVRARVWPGVLRQRQAAVAAAVASQGMPAKAPRRAKFEATKRRLAEAAEKIARCGKPSHASYPERFHCNAPAIIWSCDALCRYT